MTAWFSVVSGDNHDALLAKHNISVASLIRDKSTNVYVLCGVEMDRIDSAALNKTLAVLSYDCMIDAFNVLFNDVRGLDYA